MKTKRILAVDYIKCLACLLILNSHIASLYPSFLKRLAFGGYFGNCLFFFCSGFLLTKISNSFPKWYGKKIVRVIIPYYIVLPLLFFDNRLDDLSIFNVIMPVKLYHFIPTILILYIAYYYSVKLNDYFKLKYQYIVAVFAVIGLLFFYFVYDYNNRDIYEHFTFLEINSYYITMLLGAMVRNNMTKMRKWYVYIAGAVLSFGMYGYQSVFGFPKYLSIFQLTIGISFSYCIACFFVCIEEKLKHISIVDFISTVTLEAYIVHYFCIDAYAAIGFPTSWILFFISVIGIAYCIHFISENLSKKLLSLSYFQDVRQ